MYEQQIPPAGNFEMNYVNAFVEQVYFYFRFGDKQGLKFSRNTEYIEFLRWVLL